MMREILHGDVDQFGALEAWLKKQKVDNDAKKHLETQQKKREKEKSHEAKLAVHRDSRLEGEARNKAIHIPHA